MPEEVSANSNIGAYPERGPNGWYIDPSSVEPIVNLVD